MKQRNKRQSPRSPRVDEATRRKAWKISNDRWQRSHGRQVVRELSREEQLQMKSWFDLIDEDGGGTLDLDEIAMLFDALQMDFDEERVIALLKMVKEGGDEDDGGEDEVELNFNEFVALMSRFGEELGKQDSDEESDDDSEEEDHEVDGGGREGEVEKGQMKSKGSKKASIPAHLMIQTFKRRKLLEQLMDAEARKEIEIPIEIEKDLSESSKALLGLPEVVRKFLQTKASQLVEIFRSMDSNGDGKVDKREMATCLHLMGLDLEDGVLARLFKVFDKDGSGSISYGEMHSALAEASEILALAAERDKEEARRKAREEAKNEERERRASQLQLEELQAQSLQEEVTKKGGGEPRQDQGGDGADSGKAVVRGRDGEASDNLVSPRDLAAGRSGFGFSSSYAFSSAYANTGTEEQRMLMLYQS